MKGRKCNDCKTKIKVTLATGMIYTCTHCQQIYCPKCHEKHKKETQDTSKSVNSFEKIVGKKIEII